MSFMSSKRAKNSNPIISTSTPTNVGIASINPMNFTCDPNRRNSTKMLLKLRKRLYKVFVKILKLSHLNKEVNKVIFKKKEVNKAKNCKFLNFLIHFTINYNGDTMGWWAFRYCVRLYFDPALLSYNLRSIY
nr:hypothetical protein Itr_chr08CG18180 [Ipomoea trifida]